MHGVAWPERGRYVVAVSGGRDSVTLLHLLSAAAKDHGYKLVVAHYDHGLRADSAADRRLVERLAGEYGWPFAAREGKLGRASEDTARSARHRFLRQVRHFYGAAAVVTAHHQDDVIETSLLNLARGTGRRGLAPMAPGGEILRPLLAVPRREIADYAQKHALQWREDSTNNDLTNPRNFLRHELLAKASPEWRKQYLELMHQAGHKTAEADVQIGTLAENCRKFAEKASGSNLDTPRSGAARAIPRHVTRDLSLAELAELILYFCHQLTPGFELQARLAAEVALFAKTGRPGRVRPLRQGLTIRITRDGAEILPPGS